ncbi:HAMP domain-containing protein [Azotobacter chroococcum subsp. isscasi]|uniref:sensor histidine kinase n=1 Tax=Azotobacter chroococcum TaxID=353 RepID=UPI001039AA8D|nr:sensor histidine kinase [Azotobacter chroococcum]TBW07624.1 HAMP domain-containing protein [Azotobacter chroococcum subsp. isscasi]
MRSIQRRLGFGLIGVLLGAGLLLAQSTLWMLDAGLRRYLEDDLREQAEALLTSLARGRNGIQLDEPRLPGVYQRPYSGHYFRIDLPGESWRSRSLWDHALTDSSTTGLQAGLVDGPGDQRLLLYRADYRRFGQSISISVASDYTPILQAYRRVQWVGCLLGLGVLVLVVLLQRLTVRRALRPLEEVRRQVEQLQQGQRQALDPGVPVELEPLVAQINHLLRQTESTLQRSRHAVGNLGHALKTPLAVLTSLAARAELAACPELQASLQEQLAQIEQRLARELGRARLAGEALPASHFDCAAELPGLFATLAMVHNRGLALDWQSPPGLRLPWDREDVLELLGNLLDNACKWARARVTLEIAKVPEGWSIRVDDDGPGMAAEFRGEALNRGIRLDEQVAGHGLGLAIVRDILDAWHGRLALQDSPLGGLRVAIELPSRREAG